MLVAAACTGLCRPGAGRAGATEQRSDGCRPRRGEDGRSCSFFSLLCFAASARGQPHGARADAAAASWQAGTTL